MYINFLDAQNSIFDSFPIIPEEYRWKSIIDVILFHMNIPSGILEIFTIFTFYFLYVPIFTILILL